MQTIKLDISSRLLSALLVVSCNGAPDPVTQDAELGTRPLTETFELCASDWSLPTESGEVLGLTGVDWIDRAADPLRIHFSSDGSLETTWEDGEDVHFDGQWSREGQALHVLRWYELEGSQGVHSVKRELSFFATSETALFHSSCGALTFYRGFGDSSDDTDTGLNGIWVARTANESYELAAAGPVNVKTEESELILLVDEGSVESEETYCRATSESGGDGEVSRNTVVRAGSVVGSAGSFELTLTPEGDEGYSQDYLGKMLGDDVLILYPTSEDSSSPERTNCLRAME